ncbi:MAG: hypothetical protein Q7R56_01845 [Nanoarchaeota archaeon]|nr:hypothetical protein [Nanoarchaeota archaeon]
MTSIVIQPEPSLVHFLEQHLQFTLTPEERQTLEQTINTLSQTILDSWFPTQPTEFSYEFPRQTRKQPITITTPLEKHHVYLGRLLNNHKKSHQHVPSSSDLLASVYEFFHGTTAPYVYRILRNPSLLELMEKAPYILSILGRITSYLPRKNTIYVTRKPVLIIPGISETETQHVKAWEESWANHWTITPEKPITLEKIPKGPVHRITREEYEQALGRI